MVTEPRLPPIIIMMGFLSLIPHSFSPLSAFPKKSFSLMGVPVSIPFSFGIYFKVSGKFAQIFFAKGKASLLASPGVISDSWMMTGTLLSHPVATTGTVT